MMMRNFIHARIKEIPLGLGVLTFLCHQRISQRAVRTSPEKLLDPLRPIASRRVRTSTCLETYCHL